MLSIADTDFLRCLLGAFEHSHKLFLRGDIWSNFPDPFSSVSDFSWQRSIPFCEEKIDRPERWQFLLAAFRTLSNFVEKGPEYCQKGPERGQ